ncbi:hypothetical protein [Mesonia maritima]|uniref:Steroid 5-alpha reductase family enzyme n=1 Tax=Mesonia maritima TaxID=1793873 RepID=A0ABU1K285_9FLAO|nr:hypothetical protein [Mesonia maritima]MDR6299726.1 steroid 5-alpha reductase family enzyme [Mesonia maritima]
MFSALLQTEIPQPAQTEPDQEYGIYSFQDFIIANWGYITIVLILAIIVLMYGRHKKRERKKHFEEYQRQKEN